MSAHIQFFIHQYLQVLVWKTVLNQLIIQSELTMVIALTYVEDLALGLAELHDVHMQPILKTFNAIPSVLHINCTTQLSAIYKLAESVFNPIIYVKDKDIK